MTRERKQSAVYYLMFLTKKRSVYVKARGCADGCKHQKYMTKQYTYAPTVSTESLMISILMYDKEGRYVATIGIPGNFIHSGMKDEVNMKLQETISDLFAKIKHHQYEQYVTIENGKKVLYVRIK